MSCDGRSAAELRRCSGSAVRQCGLQRRSDGRAPAGAACSDGAAGCFATELRAGTSSRQTACSGGGAFWRWVVDGGRGVRRRWTWAMAVELGDGGGVGRDALALTLSMLRRCFILGVLGTCMVVLGTQGINYSSATLSAGISNLMPGFTFVLAMIFRMEKFEVKRRTWQAKSVGTIVSIIGASQYSLLSQDSSRWVVGGAMIVASYVAASGWYILKTAILKDYQELITIVFFSTLFSSIQCAIVTLLLERKLDAWKLQPGIGMAAIVASAVLEPVCVNNITAFCLVMKGPLYVAMFKPLGVVIAAILNLIFLAEALHLGSIVGSIIISVGFYVVMWGMLREATDIILCETTEAASDNQTSPLLQK
nr:WAT1-related protein At5g40240-like [Ipomoea batatas]